MDDKAGEKIGIFCFVELKPTGAKRLGYPQQQEYKRSKGNNRPSEKSRKRPNKKMFGSSGGRKVSWRCQAYKENQPEEGDTRSWRKKKRKILIKTFQTL